jgi:RNA polymerase sigma factor (sigma-70 family)
MSNKDHQFEDSKSKLRQILESILAQKADPIFIRIKPILLMNLDRGRIHGFIGDDISLLDAYVERVAAQYQQFHPYIHKLQVERDDEVWAPLFEKLQEWAYNFLLRNNFSATLATHEIAMDCGTTAAMTLLDAYFPYDTDFEPWAHVITRNACLKFFRNETKKSVVPPQNIVELKETLSNTDDSISTGQSRLENKNEVLAALAQLPSARRQVIERYYFDGESLPEIAQTMGKTVGAIHSLHFNALQDLRKILGTNRDINL